jgi:hypothetical protein
VKRLATVVMVMAVLAGCSEEPGSSAPRKLAGSCGFPARKKPVDPKSLPKEFLLEGVEVSIVEVTKERLTAALNVPHSVQQALDLYRDVVKDLGYKILQVDNEGFEAELYMRKGNDLGAMQVRMSTCEDAVAVYINIVRGAAANVPGR